MKILNSNKNIQNDLKKVKKISLLVEKRLSKINKNDMEKIDSFTLEELQDLNKILGLTDYILCKYEHKKEVHSLMKDFVGMITKSTPSLEELDDEIYELIISAENAIKRIKEIQNNVSNNFVIDRENQQNEENLITNPEKIGSNNFTTTSIPVYPQEYQQKPRVETEQVI